MYDKLDKRYVVEGFTVEREGATDTDKGDVFNLPSDCHMYEMKEGQKTEDSVREKDWHFSNPSQNDNDRLTRKSFTYSLALCVIFPFVVIFL